MEKAKFELVQTKHKGGARLASFNSSWFLPAPWTSSRNNKIISVISHEVFTLIPQFADLPQKEFPKIIQNRFQPWNLYKLQHLNSQKNMHMD